MTSLPLPANLNERCISNPKFFIDVRIRNSTQGTHAAQGTQKNPRKSKKSTQQKSNTHATHVSQTQKNPRKSKKSTQKNQKIKEPK
jgi:hypothetical protein